MGKEVESIEVEDGQQLRLLLFNLVTDANHPVQGFTTVWINALAEHCDYIDVVTMQAGRLAVANNVRVYSLGKEKGHSKPRRAFNFYRILWRLLRQRTYDACFSHMNPLFAVMGAPLLKLRKIPVTLWYTHKSVTPTLRLAEKLVNRIVTASSESFRLKSDKVIVTGHGIDTTVFVPSIEPRPPERPFTILSVGRIAPIKNLETLIEATHLLITDYNMTDIRVRIVGNIYSHDENYAARLRKLVTCYNLDHVIEFAGPVPFDEVVQQYRQADVAINLSRTGSVDKVVLEAMSCGVPIITSNEAFYSTLEMWPDTLLESHDIEQELVQRLTDLTARPVAERTIYGQELRKVVVEGHSLDVLVETLIEKFDARAI